MDSIPPSSSVNADKNLTNNENISLNITATDNVGIKNITIYYSYSLNKSWSEWYIAGYEYNISFNLSSPGFYAFYSIATDFLNNTENFPSEPDCIVKFYNPDLNHDGRVNVLDLVKIIVKWGKDDPYSDLNGDGVVNVKDLILLLLNWTG